MVEDTFGCPAFAPYSGGTVDLAANEIITIGQKIPKKSDEKPSKLKSASAFNRLVAAAKRLLNVVYKNEGLANKDMAKFETQIQNLQISGIDNAESARCQGVKFFLFDKKPHKPVR